MIRIIATFIVILVFSSIVVPNVSAEIKVYCPYCKQHLYTYKYNADQLKEGLYPQDLEPANASVPFLTLRDKFICPYDGAPLNGWLYWAWEQKRPLPEFRYKAYNIYTKDANGNFVWVPWGKVEVDSVLMNSNP